MNILTYSGLNYLVVANLNHIDIYKASVDKVRIKDQILIYIASSMEGLSGFYKAGLILLIMSSRVLIVFGCGNLIFRIFPFTTLNRFIRGHIFLRIFELLPIATQYDHP